MLCKICYRYCELGEGQTGFCGARVNRAGENLCVPSGTVTSIAYDPIEKKNCYHFYPGSTFLTVGFSGCSFKCSYCQNWRIVERESPEYPCAPEDIAQLLISDRPTTGIAFSYSEPTHHYEDIIRICEAVRKVRGALPTPTLVYTNGYASRYIYQILSPWIDAWIVSVRGDQKAYDQVAPGIDLQKIVSNLDWMVEGGRFHLEIPYIAMTDISDGPSQLEWLVDWNLSTGGNIPVHILRTIPHWRFRNPPTDIEKLFSLREYARHRGLKWVYVGNVQDNWQNTTCPDCAQIIVERNDLGMVSSCLDGCRCPQCGARIPVLGRICSDYENALERSFRRLSRAPSEPLPCL